MSQEKVDRYKEQKKNRKAILAKKKEMYFLQNVAAVWSLYYWQHGLDIQQWIPIMPRQTARLYMQM